MPITYLVAGVLPDFMKVASTAHAYQTPGGCSYKIIDTGQHVDREMYDVRFVELDIPAQSARMSTGGDARGADGQSH